MLTFLNETIIIMNVEETQPKEMPEMKTRIENELMILNCRAKNYIKEYKDLVKQIADLAAIDALVPEEVTIEAIYNRASNTYTTEALYQRIHNMQNSLAITITEIDTYTRILSELENAPH